MFRMFFSIQDTGICECEDGQQVCHGLSKAVEGLLQVLPGRPTLDWIVSTHQEYIEKRWQRQRRGRKKKIRIYMFEF